jgi:hypothetical protein
MEANPPVADEPIPQIPDDAQWNCVQCTYANRLTLETDVCEMCGASNSEQVVQMLQIIDPQGLLLNAAEAAAAAEEAEEVAQIAAQAQVPPVAAAPPIVEPVRKFIDVKSLPPFEEMKEYPQVYDKEYLMKYYRHFLTKFLPADIAPFIPPDLVNFMVHFIEEGFSVGDIIECQDKIPRWCIAQVVAIKEGELRVHYVGWSDKWDEWIPWNSERIAPLYSHTDGKDTGPKTQARLAQEIQADPNLVQEMANMGFVAEEAAAMLKIHRNNLESAINAMIGQ